MRQWFRLAIKDIAANRMRYTVLALSMLIGTLSAVAVAVSSSTVVDALIAQEEVANGREGSYTLGVSDATELMRSTFHGLQTKYAAAAQSVLDLGENDAVAGGFLLESKVVISGLDVGGVPSGSVLTRWLDGAYSDFYRFPIVQGKELASRGVLPASINLNEAAASEFGLRADDLIRVHPDVVPGAAAACPAQGIEFQVVGIVADGKDFAQAYGSLPALVELCPDALANHSVELRWVAPFRAGESERVMRGVLDRYAIAFDPDIRRADTVHEVSGQVSLVSLLFSVTCGLMLVVTVIAITNVGLATVRERSTELSIRQAFGARPWQVVGQVLGGSLLLGIAVAILGILLTLIGVYWIVPKLIPAASAIGAPVFPWVGCLAAMGASLSAAIVGGLLPAWAALRLPVAVILRR